MKNKALSLFKWEDKQNGDFPFYNGKPVAVSGATWLFLLVAVVVAMTVDLSSHAIINFMTDQLRIPHAVNVVILVLSFPAILLGALWLAFRNNIKTLFRRIRGKDLWFIVWWTFVSLLAATMIALFVSRVLHIPVVSDTALSGVTEGGNRLKALIEIMPQLPFQLLGEELVTVIPFLFILTMFADKLKVPRKHAIVAAWILSALIFGLYHFKAYDWHLVQMFVIIGSGRLFLTFAYLKTKNLWVSFGTHFLYDSLSILLISASHVAK